MQDQILYAMLAMGGLGAAFGIGLSIASKKFAVEVDPRVAQIIEALPGVNCGACGLAGCAAFAEAVVAEKVPVTGCLAGGKDVAEKVADVMGAIAEADHESKVAILKCAGTSNRCSLKCIYEGIESCSGAALIGSGPKSCFYGCLMHGDCIESCKFDALSFGDNGLPEVDLEKCVACGACVKACPKGLFELVPKKSLVHVLCNSKAPGKDVRKVCKVGCIACRICEKNCPYDAIHVVENIAVIDYEKCTNCGTCAEKCPRKIIEDRTPEPGKEN